MESEIVVSVVVAVYNMEKYLSACIESVLAQSYPNYELILVNDGSRDSSEEIIDRFVKSRPETIRKINKENGGLSSARNIALPTLRGKYVTFLDADDYYDRDYLKNLVEKAEAEELDMVCSGQHKVTDAGEILNTIRYTLKNGQCLQRRLNISGKLYRTAYIRKWELSFPEGKTYEDNSFNLQALFLSPRVGFLEYEGYYQVVHEGSITSKAIDASRLPFEEWRRCAQYVKSAAVEGVDLQLFDFTYVSFLTYFLMVRNRKREYLSNENKSTSMDSVYQIAEVFEDLTNRFFPEYGKNKYTKLFRYGELPFTQKLGTRVFAWFCRRRRLKTLVKLVYSIV